MRMLFAALWDKPGFDPESVMFSVPLDILLTLSELQFYVLKNESKSNLSG